MLDHYCQKCWICPNCAARWCITVCDYSHMCGDDGLDGVPVFTELERVYASAEWDRKWSYVVPGGDIIQIFREASSDAAGRCLASMPDESDKYCRSLYLFNDSLGQALAVCEERW